MNKFVLALLLVASAGNATGVRVLIPVNAYHVPGINDSLWTSTLAITNHSDRPIAVGGIEPCQLNPCQPTPIPPSTTIFPGYTPFVGVDDRDLADLTFELRVQDVSRQSQTSGSTIPTVSELQAYTGRTLTLTDIVSNSDFRSMLRIYDFDPGEARQVKIRIFAVNPEQRLPGDALPDQLLVERNETFSADSDNPFTFPPIVQVPLWTIPEINGSTRLRIDVVPLTEGLRFWAFVSATNNTTQHVTIINPQ